MGSSGFPAAQGLPKACRAAPEGLPRAISGSPELAWELARTWQGLPRTVPDLPRRSGRPAQSCPKAPKACPGARKDLAKPAQGRLGLPRSSGSPAQRCSRRPRATQNVARATQELPRSCPRVDREAFGLDSPKLPQDGCNKSQFNSATQDIVEKASEHAVESALDIRAPCFVPWRLPRSGTRYNKIQ